MQIVNIRELKLHTKKVIEKIPRGSQVLITQLGKPVALMRSLSDKELDEKFSPLWKRSKNLAKNSGYKRKDVNRLIASVRKRKK